MQHLLAGFLMGTADVVPGVSGGTVALVLGIYERLVASIRNLAAGRWREVEWGLVLPLGAGILAAVGLGSVVIPPLLDRYPVVMLALFFGLVAGSLPVPWRRIDVVRPGHVALAVVAAVMAFALSGLPPATVEHPSLPQVFGAAAFAICAMILPGVSGAFLLKVLGVYEVTLEAVRAGDVAYVGVFVLGALVGLAAFAQLLSFLLGRWHDATMAALVGLMAGALRALWPWQTDDRALLAPPAEPGTAAVALVALAGLAAVLLLARGTRPDSP